MPTPAFHAAAPHAATRAVVRVLNLRKQYRSFYQPSAHHPEIVDVPELTFLAIDGRIEPGEAPATSAAFQNAVQALYGAAYTLKFMSKLRPVDPIDYPVMALEALWWVDDGRFELAKPDNWRWRAMILQPPHITPALLAEALASLRTKKPTLVTDGLRLETYREGLCVQMLHVGPYATEPATVATMRAFAAGRGLRERFSQAQTGAICGHHEIYLSDPRRAAPRPTSSRPSSGIRWRRFQIHRITGGCSSGRWYSGARR